MLKHNLESDTAEEYELVQVISEDKGREAELWCCLKNYASFWRKGWNVKQLWKCHRHVIIAASENKPQITDVWGWFSTARVSTPLATGSPVCVPQWQCALRKRSCSHSLSTVWPRGLLAESGQPRALWHCRPCKQVVFGTASSGSGCQGLCPAGLGLGLASVSCPPQPSPAFFVGQLKRGSRIRRGGSTAPAVSVRIYSPCFPCFPAFPPAVCNTTPSHALFSLFCRAGDTRQRQRVLRHEQPGELRFHPAEKSFSRWTGENEESVKPDPPQNCQTGVLE